MASQGCRGLRIQISLSSPCYAFPCRTGTCETSFTFLKPPCSPFSCTQELPLGSEFGSSRGGKEMNEGPNSTSPCLRQERKNGRLDWGDGKACCRATMFILKITRIRPWHGPRSCTKNPASPLFSKNIPYRYSSYGIKNMSKGITSLKSNKCPQAYKKKIRCP